ncbi:MAG: histidine phosphatase family protein [Planctomycetes bacterium]|nr:histidine phosphatase family protein [Planctomycetota bacterium]
MMRLLAAVTTALLLASCRSAPEAAERDVYVVRHGQAWSNLPAPERGGRTGEQTDELTPAGRRQAEAVAAQLQDAGVGAVFHSPRNRTRQTAQIIAEALSVPCVEVDALLPMTSGDESVPALLVGTAMSPRQEPGAWVLVSHSGVTACLIGEAADTPVGQRLRDHKLATGGCRRLVMRADGTWKLP